MQGTFTLPTLGARFTIGRDHVREPALRLADTAKPLAVDIETFGLGREAMKLKAVTIGSGDHAVILDPRDDYQYDIIRTALENAPAIALHNTPYDIPLLARNGLLNSAIVDKVWDTLIWARLANPGERNSFKLVDCSAQYLGTEKVDVLAQAFKAMNLSQTDGYRIFDIDRPLYVHGAAIDVIVTARIFPLVRSAAWNRITKGHPFEKWGLEGDEARRLLNREQIINRIFLRRSIKGLRADLEFLDRYREEVGEQKAVDQLVLDEAEMEVSKPAKLTNWLDEQGLIPDGYPKTKGGTGWSGEADHLKRIDHPVVQAFVRVKQAVKVENDYLQKVVDLADENDRVHATTAILGASATGRMSMSDPPLQQFPGKARGIILADEGDSLTSIDWSQIEPVIAANIAKDHPVLANYENGTSDMYTEVAIFAGLVAAGTTKADCEVPGSDALKARKQAKVILLAQLYGEGMAKLAADLRITVDEAKALRDKVFAGMPKVNQFIWKLKDMGRTHKLIFTLSGRIVPVPESFYDGKLSVAAHKAVNYTVQGSAYDVLAESLMKIHEAGLDDAVYLAMHDELVVSTEAAYDVQKIMQEPPERLCALAGRVPVLRTDRVDLGERWAAA